MVFFPYRSFKEVLTHLNLENKWSTFDYPWVVRGHAFSFTFLEKLTLHRISLSWPACSAARRFSSCQWNRSIWRDRSVKKLIDGNQEYLNEQLSNWNLSAKKHSFSMPNSSKVWAMVDSTTGTATYKQSTTTSVGASKNSHAVGGALGGILCICYGGVLYFCFSRHRGSLGLWFWTSFLLECSNSICTVADRFWCVCKSYLV